VNQFGFRLDPTSHTEHEEDRQRCRADQDQEGIERDHRMLSVDVFVAEDFRLELKQYRITVRGALKLIR